MISAPDFEEDDVQIIPADYSLLHKIGVTNLDIIFSVKAAQRAEDVVQAAVDEFYAECVTDGDALKDCVKQLKIAPATLQESLYQVATLAFDMKTKAAQAGYDLVASLAKSLHILCEESENLLPPATMIEIIEWHQNSINRLLTLKLKGNGGPFGQAILAEIEKLQSR